ncbi:MAG: hypothetical protein ABIF82_13350 [Planctomycetota bacterium]
MGHAYYSAELWLDRLDAADDPSARVPGRAAGALGENLQCSVWVRNRGDKPVVINAVSIRSRPGSYDHVHGAAARQYNTVTDHDGCGVGR